MDGNKKAFEYYSLWKELYNPNFKVAKSGYFKIQSYDETDVLNVALFGMTAKE